MALTKDKIRDFLRLIGDALRRRREAQPGLSQDAIAVSTKVNRATYQQMEAGERKYRIDALLRIFDYWNLDIMRVFEAATPRRDDPGRELLHKKLDDLLDADDPWPTVAIKNVDAVYSLWKSERPPDGRKKVALSASRGAIVKSILAAGFLMLACVETRATILLGQSKWIVMAVNDPLHNTAGDQFVLDGKYLAKPGVASREAPRFVIQCDRKVKQAYLDVGAVMQFATTIKTAVGRVPLNTTDGVRAEVEMRWDEKKSPETTYWEISNDRTALLFSKDAWVGEILTGRRSGKVDLRNLIRTLYIGVVEAAGNQILMQFDMPPDASQIVEKCNLH